LSIRRGGAETGALSSVETVFPIKGQDTMNRLISRAAPVVVAATFVLGGPAMAAVVSQTATTPGAPTTAQQTRGWSIQQITQERLNHLRDQLRITAAEEPAWNQFAQISIQNAANLDQAYRQRTERVPTANAVQNLQSFAQIQMEQAQDMQRLVPAFQSLYSKLTQQQQQIADQTFRTTAERAQARASQRMQSVQSKLSHG
jgi:LTXXQ motif family protein